MIAPGYEFYATYVKERSMTPKVKELQKESGLQAYYDAQEGQIEKFAKLIITECVQKLEDDGMVEIAIELKHHFGYEY